MKWASGVALASMIVVASAVPAQATYYDGGMPRSHFSFQAQGVNDVWKNYFSRAAQRWSNNTAMDADIGFVTISGNKMTAANYSQSWYGMYTPYGIRSLRTFLIQVNSRTLIVDGGSNSSLWIASTSTHELGHALSLADNPSTTRASLMKHSRNRTLIISPQSYDVDEVNRIY